MSLATPFKYHRPFPFCPEPLSLTGAESVLDNLELADVMGLYWNLEDITFDLSYTSATFGASGGTVSLKNFGGTDDFANIADEVFWVYSGGFWLPWSGGVPTSREPRARVCFGDIEGRVGSVGAQADWPAGFAGTPAFEFDLQVGTSVSYSGKYMAALSIYMSFMRGRSVPGHPEVTAAELWGASMCAIADGVRFSAESATETTVTIGSLVFPIFGDRYEYVFNGTGFDEIFGGAVGSGTGSYYSYP